MTTIVAALRSIESGEPHALRVAVEALGVALDALADDAMNTKKTSSAGSDSAALKTTTRRFGSGPTKPKRREQSSQVYELERDLAYHGATTKKEDVDDD